MKNWLLVAALAVGSLTAACGPVQLFCHEVGDSCGSDGECCSFGCVEGVCKANPVEGGPCRTSGDCEGRFVCEAGACKLGDRPDGDVCRNASDCASTSCVDGTCVPRTDCGSQGVSCTGSSQCCNGLMCVGGKCSAEACRSSGSSCTESAQCCSGMGCGSGSCTSVCRTWGGTCTQDNDCCSGYSCMGGECRNSCGSRGYSCDANSECCNGMRCADDGAGAKKCRPGQLGESCTLTAECDDYQGLICNGGTCDYAQCNANPGAKCLAGDDCCAANGLDCGSAGTCCLAQNAACDKWSGTTAGCCPGSLCLDATGKCGACLAAGTASPAANDCCTGLRGTTGTCCLADGSASTQNSLCCSELAQNGACCSGEGTSCDGTDVCCDGLVCEPSYAGSTSKVCRRPLGAACGTDTFYPANCSGGSNAWCSGGKCCLQPAAACSTGSDCCSGTCGTDGKCAAMPLDGACESDASCASLACENSGTTASNTCCANPGQACGTSSQCCQWPDGTATMSRTYVCGGAASTCCLASGQSCTSSTASQCCSGVCRSNGTCE